jgi:hypothetical protein
MTNIETTLIRVCSWCRPGQTVADIRRDYPHIPEDARITHGICETHLIFLKTYNDQKAFANLSRAAINQKTPSPE